MLMTINLSESESLTYSGAARAYLREYAVRTARRLNRRFVQIVAANGNIVDVLEAA